MRSTLSPLVLPMALIAVGGGVMLPVPVDAQTRLFQQILSLVVQSIAAGAAAVLLWHAAAAYGRADRERRVWQMAAAAAVVWVLGLAAYAAAQWEGQAHPYPSGADALFAMAFLLLGGAVATELRLVRAMLPRTHRLLLLGGAGLTWTLVAARVLWPVVSTPLGPAERILNLFYPTAAIALLWLALAVALAFRGGTSGYIWIAVGAGLACFAVASLGFVSLTWYEAYADTHPVNLLRVAGFGCLGAAGLWQRRAFQAL